MSTYCPTCGSSNPDEAKNCHYCDTSLARFSVDGALSPGTLLHYKYRITQLIKAGGMGSVYLATDIKTNKVKAVKELIKQHCPEEDQYLIQRFKEEAEILSRLKHTNLPGVNDYFLEYDKYYLVMDFIEGEDLENVLEQEGDPGLAELDVADWAMQIASVLHYLHNQDPPILYRDLKPSNIMLRCEDGTAMLIDFGLARTIQPGSNRSKTAIGTEGYSPPEQYMGNPEIRSDLYALGATMHHLLTGNFPSVPFQFSNVRELNPDVSAEMEYIVMKAVQLDVNDRFSSAKEMYDRLLDLYPELQERVDYLASLKLDDDETIEVVEEVEEIIEEVEAEVESLEEEAHVIEAAPPPRRIPLREDKDEDEFSTLIKKLKSRDMAEKEEAIIALGDLGNTKAIPYLVELIELREKPLLQAIMETLGKLKDPRAIPYLVKFLDEPDFETKQKAVLSLGEIGDDKCVLPLAKALVKCDAGTRAVAAYALGNLGKKEALKPLVDAFIEDVDPDVRYYSAESINQLDTREELPDLTESASDDGETRKDLMLMFFPEFLTDARDKISKKAVSTYKESIEEKLKPYMLSLQSDDWRTRKEACQALGNMRIPEAVPYLIEAIKDENELVCRAAGYALARFQNAVESLISLLNYSNELTVQMAMWALGELKAEEALPHIIEKLRKGKPDMKQTAAYALGNIQSKKAVKALLECIIENSSREIRMYAADALAKIEEERPVSEIIKIAKSDDKSSRQKVIAQIYAVRKSNTLHSSSSLIDPKLFKQSGTLAKMEEAPPLPAQGVFERTRMAAPSVTDLITIALNDPDETTRQSAIRGLIEIDDGTVVDQLIEILTNSSSIIQQRAILALAEFKAKYSVPLLLELLSKNPDPQTRACSAIALGKLEDKGVLSKLCNSLLNDPDIQVRKSALDALAKIGDKSITGILLQASKKEKDLELCKSISQVFSKLKFKS